MKVIWCWRCKMDIPMLEPDEAERVFGLQNRGLATLDPESFPTDQRGIRWRSGRAATTPRIRTGVRRHAARVQADYRIPRDESTGPGPPPGIPVRTAMRVLWEAAEDSGGEDLWGVHETNKPVGVGLNWPKFAFWGLLRHQNDIYFSTQVIDSMVGAGRFERPTPCAQGRCATRLRYAPTFCASLILNHFPNFRYRPACPNRPKNLPTVAKP